MSFPWNEQRDKVLYRELVLARSEHQHVHGIETHDHLVIESLCKRMRQQATAMGVNKSKIIPSQLRKRINELKEVDATRNWSLVDLNNQSEITLIQPEESESPEPVKKPRATSKTKRTPPPHMPDEVKELFKPAPEPTPVSVEDTLNEPVVLPIQVPVDILHKVTQPDLAVTVESLQKLLMTRFDIFKEDMQNFTGEVTRKVSGLSHKVQTLETSLESIRSDIQVEFAMLKKLYKDFMGKDYDVPDLTTAQLPLSVPVNPVPLEVQEDSFQADPSQETEEVKLEEEPVKEPELSPQNNGSADPLAKYIDEFKARFANKRLGIIGGNYKRFQADKLVKELGVVCNAETWLVGKPNKLRKSIMSHVSGKHIDLLFVFRRSLDHNSSEQAIRCARDHGIPCIAADNFHSGQMARAFLTIGRNMH